MESKARKEVIGDVLRDVAILLGVGIGTGISR